MNNSVQRPLLSTLLICAAVIAIGGLMVAVIFSTEPEAQREAATRKAPMPVEVVEADYGDFQPIIQTMATVKAAEILALRPQVSGQVIKIAPGFTPGRYLQKGDVLLQIDPADYQNALDQQLSELIKAESAYQLEQGEQSIAERDYAQLNKTLDPMQKALVLREPQLKAAKAAVQAAKARVAQAQLNLARTTLRAPFDLQVLSREVSVGTQVSNSQVLGQLIGVNSYWVEATLPSDKVRWLPKNTPTTVKIHHKTWAPEHTRTGQLLNVIAALEDKTRMARVLIEVQDPLAITQPDQPALAVGSYVNVSIPATRLSNVVKLDRKLVRKGNTTWVMADNALRVRALTIDFLDADFAYVRQGLKQGDMIITTSLSNIKDGAPLRLKSSHSQSAESHHE